MNEQQNGERRKGGRKRLDELLGETIKEALDDDEKEATITEEKATEIDRGEISDTKKRLEAEVSEMEEGEDLALQEKVYPVYILHRVIYETEAKIRS